MTVHDLFFSFIFVHTCSTSLAGGMKKMHIDGGGKGLTCYSEDAHCRRWRVRCDCLEPATSESLLDDSRRPMRCSLQAHVSTF